MKKIFIAFAVVSALLFSACTTSPNATQSFSQPNNVSNTPAPTALSPDIPSMDFDFTNSDLNGEYTETGAVYIVFSGDAAKITGEGASASGSSVTIESDGTYIIRGESDNAMLIVNAGKEVKPQLVLNGVSITNPNGPAIYIKSADKVFVTLADGSNNYIADGASYEIEDDGSTLDAALFSKEDLTINGSGKLTVKGNYKHAITSKDDLVITGGEFDITSVKVGLDGKDCVKISGGTIYINAGSDGIRSDNSEDADKGYVYISGGKFNIAAGNDGIQAETVLNIEDGEITVKTNGGSANALSSGGSIGSGRGFLSGIGSQQPSSGTTESAKGLKAGSYVIISGGVFEIDSSDDSIHSNENINITGGEFNIKSGDDGIHSDTKLDIYGGDINISKSYEGIESSTVNISGGNISLVASDDGINASGGNDSSSISGRPGQGNFTSPNGIINISGGYIFVDASGDGIDSNGSITVSGGVTLVSGSTNSGNGAFDYDSSATVTGGVVIALGSSGMSQGFSASQNQGALLCSFSTQSAGTSLSLCDENGKVIVSFTPQKNYQSAAITAPAVQSGNKYKLVSGATVANTDENGYAADTEKTGGTVLVEINMTSNLYGSGMGQGGFPIGPGRH